MARCVFGCWHAHGFARPDIELSPMPWANQAIAVELTITKGASIVGAHVLDAMDLVVDFHKHHESIIDFEGLRLVRADLVSGANVMELGHCGCFFHSYLRTWRAIAAPSASRTLSMVMRSKICWKKPVTIIRIASDRVKPRDCA